MSAISSCSSKKSSHAAPSPGAGCTTITTPTPHSLAVTVICCVSYGFMVGFDVGTVAY